MIHLSFDQDWAPAFATAAISEALAAAGLCGTLFVTHDDGEILARATPTLELGWHPNFLPGSSHGDSMGAVLDHMAALVPDATGARAHCLVRGTPTLAAYRARGLAYEAADLRDGEPGLLPFWSWVGMWRFPIWFEDDVHLLRGLACRREALDWEAPGLKVMTFHPVLVALNAASLDGYNRLKADLGRRGRGLSEATREDVARHRDPGPGVGDLFLEVVAWLAKHPARCGGSLGSLAARLSEGSTG